MGIVKKRERLPMEFMGETENGGRFESGILKNAAKSGTLSGYRVCYRERERERLGEEKETMRERDREGKRRTREGKAKII